MCDTKKPLLHSYSDMDSAKKILLQHPAYQTFNNEVFEHKNSEPGRSTDGNPNGEEHCHSQQETDGVDKTARRKLIIASVLCMCFMIGEIVGGTLANSLAIMTDAAHLLSDFASFMISLFALYLASRPATKRMSFGWHRAEVVGALVSVLLIWVVTGILVYMAVLRVISQDFEIEPNAMLITSGFGVIVNVIMACSLHQHGHGHGHSHGGHGHSQRNLEDKEHGPEYDIETSHPEKENEEGTMTGGNNNGTTHAHVTPREGSELKRLERRTRERTNINVRAAFIHVIGDLFQSAGVLIAAFIVYFKPEWKLADPICTFLFSVLVLLTTVNILRDTMNVLMEGTPRSLDFDEVKRSLLKLEGVCLLHNLRIWSLTMSKTALSVHLAIDENKDVQDVLREATKLLMDQFEISDATIQIEAYIVQMDDCARCQGPST